jgi:hypothetical protein
MLSITFIFPYEVHLYRYLFIRSGTTSRAIVHTGEEQLLRGFE